MNQTNVILGAIIVVLIGIVIIGCSKKNTPSHSEDGEESGTELARNETYDQVRNGARLILTYDAQDNAFNGTVENTTNETLKQVRVEVHLSNGKELGPTPAADLAPGKKRDVQLIATSTDFNGWTAHPEVGESEHGSGTERGEHNREGDSEHDGEGDEHN